VSVCARSVSACTVTTLHRDRPWPPRWCRLCMTGVVPQGVRIPRSRKGCMHVADAAQWPGKAAGGCVCTCIAIYNKETICTGAATRPLGSSSDSYMRVSRMRKVKAATACYNQEFCTLWQIFDFPLRTCTTAQRS
jgi:hypothetical protein